MANPLAVSVNSNGGRPRCREAVMIASMGDQFHQAGFGVRFEWGPAGAEHLAPHVACLVLVDVLSFTTSVTVAVEAGTHVHPYHWHDDTAAVFAEQIDARLAVERPKTADQNAEAMASPWSLSPAALRQAPFTPRLVLPSPNGSAIAASTDHATVVAGSLRNAKTVGQWLAAQNYGTVDSPVGVVAAGERWPDGSLRPALEDMLGAGAVLSALTGESRETCSPEAAVAVAAFAATSDVEAAVTASSSGGELIAEGFAEDVAIATQLDNSAVIPVLIEGAFTPVN